MKKVIWILGIASLWGSGLLARETVSGFLEDLWAENPRLAARALEVEGAEAAERAAGRWADPMLGLELFAQGGMADYRLMVQQTLPRPGELSAQRDQRRAQVEGRQWDQVRDQWQLAEAALGTLARVLEEKQREQLLQETLALVEEIYEAAQRQVGAGTLSQVQVLQWDNERRVLKRRIASSVEKQKALRQRLAFWQGLAEAQMPELALESMVEKFRPPEARESLPPSEPMAEGLQARIRETEAARREVKSLSRPRFGVGLEYTRMPSADEDEIMLMGTVSLPIWRESLRAETRAVDSQRAALQKLWRDRQGEWMSENAQLQFEWEDLLAEIRLLEDELIPQAEEILEQTRSAYLSGEVGYSDIVLAQRSLLEWSLELVEIRRRQVETAARWQTLAAELRWEKEVSNQNQENGSDEN